MCVNDVLLLQNVFSRINQSINQSINNNKKQVRGKAYAMLGKWAEAAKDLGDGQRIDYDEDTYQVQKKVCVWGRTHFLGENTFIGREYVLYLFTAHRL